MPSSPVPTRRAAPADPWRRASSRALHPSADPDEGRPLVATIAAGLAAVSVPWELADEVVPGQRSYELLLTTDHYDAWLIHWPPGTGLDAHDHGGSTGALAVVSGTLDEDVFVDGVTIRRRIGPGESVAFGAEHVHAVSNRGRAGATSVHVYAPPLRSMSFHDGVDAGSAA